MNIDSTQTLTDMFFGQEHKLTDLKTESLNIVKKLPKGDAMLVILKGANIGSRYLLKKDTTVIGRGEDCDIFLDDQTVSRAHTQIEKKDDDYYILDNASLNGTYVNFENVTKIQKLKNEDLIQIGKFQLTFFKSV
jgi:pSer/pThr/pTyr-binding forkhead associated (FHA) protein